MKQERRRGGFTLVEVIVVLVILAVLAAIMIPAMTGWIDKARNGTAISQCRACVLAGQTIVSTAYGTAAPIDNSTIGSHYEEILELAEAPGAIDHILLSGETAIAELYYTSDSGVFVQYVNGEYSLGGADTSLALSVWEWMQANANAADPQAVIRAYYNAQQDEPRVMTEVEKTAVFGDVKTEDGAAYYLYPMGIYIEGEVQNIQYVTTTTPWGAGQSGRNRYQAQAFIVDGKKYVSSDADGNALARIRAKDDYFQDIMISNHFSSTQDFIDFITEDDYYKLVE
ncbi:MAG: prepilin-type N-terminal cleavage/methylation domain-containing protein [Bacillota bacterium]|nr:prepilin-type N-terminal cleavage/methylation domain-containing protein [Bacillota bacterium]